MTNKRSPETFTRLFDAFSESTRVKRACRSADISAQCLMVWTRASERGDPAFQNITYGDVTQPLHLHLADCKAIALATLEGEFVADQTEGYYVNVIHHGEPAWVDDEQLVKLGWEFCKEMGLPDMKKRDANGNRIPLRQWVPPTTEGRLGILRPRHPDYKDQRQVNVSGGVSLGVRVIGQPRNRPQPVEIIGETVKQIVHEEATDMSDLTGDDVATDAQVVDAGQEAEVVSAGAQPAAPPVAPLERDIAALEAKPMSPLAQDALTRLRAKQASNKINPTMQRVRPPPSSASVSTDQDDCRVLNPGSGGFKVS